MKPEKQVIAGVEQAQKVLTEYIEPRGPASGRPDRDCKETVGKLLDVLDDQKFVEALDKVKHDQSSDDSDDLKKSTKAAS